MVGQDGSEDLKTEGHLLQLQGYLQVVLLTASRIGDHENGRLFYELSGRLCWFLLSS